MNKQRTEIKVHTSSEECPRCGVKSYGTTSETDSFNQNGDLVQHMEMKKKYCSMCAYVEGDNL